MSFETVSISDSDDSDDEETKFYVNPRQGERLKNAFRAHIANAFGMHPNKIRYLMATNITLPPKNVQPVTAPIRDREFDFATK